jgi:hypothetical protein
VSWRILEIFTNLCGKIEYLGSGEEFAYFGFYLFQLCLYCSAL